MISEVMTGHFGKRLFELNSRRAIIVKERYKKAGISIGILLVIDFLYFSRDEMTCGWYQRRAWLIYEKAKNILLL